MATTTYTTPTMSVNVVGARTDSAGVAATDTTAEEARFPLVMFTEGYLTPATAFQVTAQTVPNMTVKVGSGTSKADYYVVSGEVAGQGNYLTRLDTTSQNVTIDAADASQTRTDEIYLVVRDNPYDSSSRALPQLAYRKGDLGGANPGPDSSWRASVILARIVVAASVTTITNANITDLRAAADTVGLSKSLIDAKGDLLVGTAADTAARLAVGANGYMVEADSAQSAGMKWALPDCDVLGSAVLASPASSITLSSIPQTHRHMKGIIRGVGPSGWSQLYCRVNGNSGFNYDSQVLYADGSTVTATRLLSWNAMEVGIIGDFDPTPNEFLVPDYSTAGEYHLFNCRTTYRQAGGFPIVWQSGTLFFGSTAAITSLTFLPAGGGNFDTGTSITLLGLDAL